MVYVSTQEKSSWMTQHKLIFNETDFMRNETILRYYSIIYIYIIIYYIYFLGFMLPSVKPEGA